MREWDGALGSGETRALSETSTDCVDSGDRTNGTLCPSCGITRPVCSRLCKRMVKVVQNRCKNVAGRLTRGPSPEGEPLVESASSASAGSARNRGDHQDLVALLEAVGFVTEKADVLLVDIEVDEAADLAVLAPEVLAQGGKPPFDVGDELWQVRGRARDFPHVVGVLLKRIGQKNSNRHSSLPPGSTPAPGLRTAPRRSFQSR